MIYGLSGQIRYYLYTTETDMRKGFDALSGIVRNELLQDPLCGDAFIFINRRRNLLKLLVWDQTLRILIDPDKKVILYADVLIHFIKGDFLFSIPIILSNELIILDKVYEEISQRKQKK